jgi:hypothetical protein
MAMVVLAGSLSGLGPSTERRSARQLLPVRRLPPRLDARHGLNDHVGDDARSTGEGLPRSELPDVCLVQTTDRVVVESDPA